VGTPHDTNIDETQATTHLGIIRNISGKLDLDKMLKTGRQTLYTLFGAGLHGRNGLNPQISKHIWSTYVVPRFLYGLEIQHLTEQQLNQLSQFQKKSLKQLQWLPEKCSIAAGYLLLGSETIETLVHKKMLGFFGQITRDKESIENQIAYRQIAIYDLNSKSWFSKLKSMLAKYNLPDALQLLVHPRKKEHVKKMVDNKVNEFWFKRMVEDKSSKSSLAMMSVSSSISAQLKLHLGRICEDCDVTGSDVTRSREPEPEMKGRSFPYTRISRVFFGTPLDSRYEQWNFEFNQS
jgi:hypothetical protein